MYNLETQNLADVIEALRSERYEIPALQRPFVWKDKQILRLVESAYQGIPLGTLCIWKQDGILLRNGNQSTGENWLVIDGQQRLAAMNTALLGNTVLTEDYEQKRIGIAFNPLTGEFALSRKKHMKLEAWIPDISPLFNGEKRKIRKAYCDQNWLSDEESESAEENIDKLVDIRSNKIGVFQIWENMPYPHVYEVFRQVNESPTRVEAIQICLAELQTHHPEVAETIVRFCLGLQNPAEARRRCEIGERHPLYTTLEWMHGYKNWSYYAYRPDKADVGSVLIWRVFGTANLDSIIGKMSPTSRDAEEPTTALRAAIKAIVSEAHFTEFNELMHPMRMFIADQQASVAYWLYLHCCLERRMDIESIKTLIYRWLLAKNLQGTLRGRPEVREAVRGFSTAENPHDYIDGMAAFTTDDFFKVELPERLIKKKALRRNREWQVWQAVQALSEDTALFSTDSVVALPQNRDTLQWHHIYPQKTLREEGIDEKLRSAIPNMAITTQSDNLAIRDTPFHTYIDDAYKLNPLEGVEHMEQHCIPSGAGSMPYEEFLSKRAELMAAKIKQVYRSLEVK